MVREDTNGFEPMLSVMKEAAIVGCGGFVGATLRYAVCGALTRLYPGSALPLGTLVVNVVGCFLLGCINGWMGQVHVSVPTAVRMLLTAGVLGGFTTFSTFGYETVALARDVHVSHAFLNVMLHVALGMLAAWSGYALVLQGR